MNVLALQHIACEPPGVFEDVLLERGAQIHRVELDEGEPLPDWRGFDAIVAMGGPMSATDDASLPWLLRDTHLVVTEGIAILMGRLASDAEWLERVIDIVAHTLGFDPVVTAPSEFGARIKTEENKRIEKGEVLVEWDPYSLPIVGYSVIDSFARYWTKTPFSKADLPTQILTQKNIGSTPLTAQGDYLGVKDFQAQFKRIWGLS